eukprot:1183965-Prorocentrum_minimum.AAC.4
MVGVRISLLPSTNPPSPLRRATSPRRLPLVGCAESSRTKVHLGAPTRGCRPLSGPHLESTDGRIELLGSKPRAQRSMFDNLSATAGAHCSGGNGGGVLHRHRPGGVAARTRPGQGKGAFRPKRLFAVKAGELVLVAGGSELPRTYRSFCPPRNRQIHKRKFIRCGTSAPLAWAKPSKRRRRRRSPSQVRADSFGHFTLATLLVSLYQSRRGEYGVVSPCGGLGSTKVSSPRDRRVGDTGGKTCARPV